MAHEVLHAIANDMRHADSGLMAPTQNRNVLISSDISMDDESATAFRQGLRRIKAMLTATSQ